MKATNVTINKMSDTGKSAYLQFKCRDRQIGYTFAYVSALEGDAAGKEVDDFEFEGYEQLTDENDEPIFYKDKKTGLPSKRPVNKIIF